MTSSPAGLEEGEEGASFPVEVGVEPWGMLMVPMIFCHHGLEVAAVPSSLDPLLPPAPDEEEPFEGTEIVGVVGVVPPPEEAACPVEGVGTSEKTRQPGLG